MLGAGVLTQNYVRNVTFENATGFPVIVTGSFRSNNQLSHTIDAGAAMTVERDIDHGDYQTVDPIENVVVKRSGDSQTVLGNLALSSTSGVLVPQYRIVSEGNSDQVQFQQINA